MPPSLSNEPPAHAKNDAANVYEDLVPPNSEANVPVLQISRKAGGELNSNAWQSLKSGALQAGQDSLLARAGARIFAEEHDCRGLAPGAFNAWREALLATERARCGARDGAPVARATLLVLDGGQFEFILTAGGAGVTADAVREALGQIVQMCRTSEPPASPAGNVVREEAKPAGRAPASGEDAASSGIAAHDTPAAATSAARLRATEEQLEEIWKTLLKLDSVSRDDDFFQIGGQSLTAARLLARIQKDFGSELSLASLLEAPTIRLQARQLHGLGLNEKAARLEKHTKEASLFLIGGDPTFVPLMNRLRNGHDWHSIGLHASDLNRLSEPLSLQCIAEYFAGVVRQMEPRGPYVLGGWCDHGLLALEIARQLSNDGEEVRLVFLLQTSNPAALAQYPGWKRRVSRIQLRWHLLQFEWRYAKFLGGSRARQYIWARLREGFRNRLGLNRVEQGGILAAGGDRGYISEFHGAGDRYRPAPYAGRVVLFRGRERTFGFAGFRDLGWGPVLTGDFRVEEVPGNHFTLYMYPNSETLGEAILKHVAGAQSSRR